MPRFAEYACSVLGLAASAAQAQGSPQRLTAAEIMSMGNNTLFDRWRPRSHFIAPSGWMNDPAGMMYDPFTDTYHTHYQFHPNHVFWGNISWGHGVSTDLFHWEDVTSWPNDSAVSIPPTEARYGSEGIFTGTAHPVNVSGQQDGTQLAFLTTVSALPTNWALYYIPQTESQSIFQSFDDGVTWQPYSENPVIDGPPEGWNITGWRDPFYLPMPALDDLLGHDEPHWYMVLGSGLKGEGPDTVTVGNWSYVGPRMPLYSAPASNLANWTFLGALWEPAANTSFGDVQVTGSYGFNFELSNFFTLPDSEGNLHYFVTVGSEGGNTTTHSYPGQKWALWNGGVVRRRDNGSVEFEPTYAGVLDWGRAYAHNSFYDPKNNRRVVWSWADEDLIDGFAAKQMGYQGSLILPSEIWIKDTYSVVDADGNLTAKNEHYLTQHRNGTYTARTLGLRPLDDVVALARNGSKERSFTVGSLEGETRELGAISDSYELSATLVSTTGFCGITVASSPDKEEYTTIYYNPSNSTIGVNRYRSSLIEQFNHQPHIGHFQPYTVASRQGCERGSSRRGRWGRWGRKYGHGKNATTEECGNGETRYTTEPITVRIFIDGSLLQVYVNDRFALTSRVYPSREDSVGLGFFADDGVQSVWRDVRVWDGLANAWPARPSNSSSPLYYDPEA